MKDFENFKVILGKHFGTGVPRFRKPPSKTNNLIGGLNHGDYESFKLAFSQRLAGLAECYPKNDSNRSHILEVLKLLANDRNWDGAYAELVAFDFLNSNRDYLSNPITLNTTVAATETLASSISKENVNFDGYYDDLDVWFDVKMFADKSGELLEGIIAEAINQLEILDVTISPEYPLDLDYAIFAQNRTKLRIELADAIEGQARPKFIKSKILPVLSYRLLWGSGVLTSVKTYAPFAHAATHHKLLFSHLKKFARKSPSLIVFVVFPWFSESVLNAGFSNELLYRAFCRRFFCQYAKNSDPAQSHLKSFVGPETMAQVTEKLSGILFLEDTSLKSFDPATHSVRGFAYINPNAVNKVSRRFRQYLSSLKLMIDDFEDDNY